MLNRIRRMKRSRQKAGFSLLELMLVVALIGILLAVVAYNMLGAGTEAKKTATRASMKTIKTTMGMYILKYSAPPPQLNVLVTMKYLEDEGTLVDGWDRPFIYDPRGRTADRPYTLGSAGEDGQTGTEDDIDVWNLKKD